MFARFDALLAPFLVKLYAGSEVVTVYVCVGERVWVCVFLCRCEVLCVFVFCFFVANNLYKCIKRITNIDLEFKLINSISFGEYVSAGGFTQKTVKEGIFVKANHIYP